MADKKYLDNTGLSYYHGKIKDYVDTADTTLQGNIDTEAGLRSSADTALGTRVSTLENAGYITKAVNDLTNYYTKSQTYTQAEVNTLIGNLKTIQIEVVASLPATGQSNIIYLVAHSHGTGDSYDEYVWVSSSSTFEKIGNTDVDLSNYYTKSEADTLLAGKQATLTFDDNPTNGSNNPVKSSGIYNQLANKVDKVSGKGLSTNDYTTTEKNKLSGIASGAQVNVIETIKVNGTAQSVSSKAVDISVPTKTSDLTNDSGFITGVTSITNSEIDALFS